jgi:hypothetical protein
MPSAGSAKAVSRVETLHALALGIAALGLLVGLVTRNNGWANLGISLVILLPPLRLATTIMDQARARSFGVAAMGVVVLAFLLFSRRIS